MNEDLMMSTTLALVSSLGLVYLCPQNNPPRCSKRRVSWTTALSSVHRKDEAFAPCASLWSRSRKEREVKILKLSVLLPLLYKIPQRTEGTAFCCSDLAFYKMVIKFIQAIRPGVKTLSGFQHLPEPEQSHLGRMHRKAPRGVTMVKNVWSRTRGLFGRGFLSYSYIKC